MNKTYAKISRKEWWYAIAALSCGIFLYSTYNLYHSGENPPIEPVPQSRAESMRDASILYQQGNSFYKEGKFEDALNRYHEAIQLEPLHEQSHISASLAAAKLGQTNHAIDHVQKALNINRNYVSGYIMLGQYQEQKQEYGKAQASYERALTFNKELFEGNLFLAKLLTRQGTKESCAHAISYAQRALDKQPHNRDSLVTLGDAYLMAGETPKAREQYETAIKHYPQSYQTLNSLGKTYEREQRMEQAMNYYQQAIKINPTYAAGHVSLAGAYFMQGNLKKGFEEYEWRWHLSSRPHLQRKWDGSDPKDKRILILSENGLGDIFQYVRFVQLLKERGATVLVHAPKSVQQLFNLCDYIDEFVEAKTQNPQYDAVTSMQSLPYYFGIDQITLPKKAYLKADEQLSAQWGARLANDTNYKIGICWAPGDDSYLSVDQKRNIDIDQFKSIANIKGLSFYSLQKGGNTTEQIKNASFKVTDFGQSFDTAHGAFMDTAAVMKNMDLIITVDTSVAHLAGALGVQTWVLLPTSPDVRWETNKSNSIWYPSIRLFRQQKAGDWESVMRQVKEKLKETMHITI